MQTHMKLVAIALFIFSLTCSSANPILGTHSTRAANTPEFRERLKQELQQWTGSYSNPNRKLLQNLSQGEMLFEAIKTNDYSGVERLLGAGADPNYTNEKGVDALTVAIINNRGSIVTLLIDSGANIKGAPGSLTERAGALNTAALYDSTDAAAALLAAGTPVDGLNSYGFSALHDCVLEEAVKLAEFLLDNGATVDLYTNTENPSTALHIAAQKQHLSLVRLLLSRGADVNCRTKDSGETPLHDATQKNAALIIQELLDNGADVDAQMNNGSTALWDAAFLGCRNAMEVLLINGADKNIKAYDRSPREALCVCVNLDEVPIPCQLQECENPTSMQKLLIG